MRSEVKFDMLEKLIFAICFFSILPSNLPAQAGPLFSASWRTGVRRVYIKYMHRVLLLIIILFISFFSPDKSFAQTESDTSISPYRLANCLSQKQFVMYGRAGCSACELEKQYFGQAFALVNYVDCQQSPQNRRVCDGKNISAFPTWEDAQGKQYKGAIPLATLSQLANCSQTEAAVTFQPTQVPGETYYGQKQVTPQISLQQKILSDIWKEYGGIFLAGLLSLFAPCLVPLLPTYLSIISGFTFAQLYGLEFSKIRGRVIKNALFFAFGFSLIFTLLGATGSIVGMIINSVMPQLLFTSGIILIILGFLQLRIIKIPSWEFDYAWVTQRKFANLGIISAAITGLVSALCWIPCIGPVLASILVLAADSQSVMKGSTYLLVYSLGVTTPFLLAAMFFPRFFNYYREKKNYLRFFSVISGIVIIIFGLVLITDKYGDFIRLYYSIINIVPVGL